MTRLLAAAALTAAVAPLFARAQSAAPTPDVTVVIHNDRPAKPISPDLFGIFFEDLNYAADGGLYAELIENRSFEYSATEQPTWNGLTGWELLRPNNARGSLILADGDPVHPNNPQYAVLVNDGGEVGLANDGFDGIVLKRGATYDFSVQARVGNVPNMAVDVRLEGKDGTVYAKATLPALSVGWKKLTAELVANADVADARLVVMSRSRGTLYLDMVSLFPRDTFHNRPNGLRADLAQTVADLKPKFVRFPGGCLVHGDGIHNIYDWKKTVGPVETRVGQKNIWRYHQTAGLGYFEYFQFCEDIGAKPLPVVAAGVSCQNSDRKWGTGQQPIPMDKMPAYVQDVLDLIEYANGPIDSKWGKVRADAGHPKPFGLQYLGVGNEDAITSEFRERYKMIADAIRAKHPEITVIGTVGPSPKGKDFDAGWAFARQENVAMVDEHYYESPAWFYENNKRYDSYDRSGPKVYLGEYASRGNELANALSEAAYMTALERNGDVVRMASYAPLLAKVGRTQWNPDLIYFNNTSVMPTVNYYAQRMIGQNSGDTYLPTTVQAGKDMPTVYASCVRDGQDVILKVVNPSDKPLHARVRNNGAAGLSPRGKATVLSGENNARTDANDPARLKPAESTFDAGPDFTYDLPARSFVVLRQTPAK